MDTVPPELTVPGVLAAAGSLHKAKATRLSLDAAADEADAALDTMAADDPQRFAVLDAWTTAIAGRSETTSARIRAAAELVEAAKLELLDAVYDAATHDGWSLRELADVARTSRGTIANVLEAGGRTTVGGARGRARRRHV